MSHELEKVNMVSRFTQSESGLEFGGLPSGKDSPSKPAGDKVFVPAMLRRHSQCPWRLMFEELEE